MESTKKVAGSIPALVTVLGSEILSAAGRNVAVRIVAQCEMSRVEMSRCEVSPMRNFRYEVSRGEMSRYEKERSLGR